MAHLTLHSDFIRVTEKDSLLTVTLSRPDKLNSITVAMYEDLRAAVRYFNDDSRFTTLLINAEGKVFSAGNDINDFLAASPESRQQGQLSPALELILELAQTKKPVIAAVQGSATGIGTTMLLHTDLVIAADNATFHTAFIQLGLVPEAGSSLLLPRLVGRQNAARMLLAGDRIEAQEAKEMGLIAYVVPADELDGAAVALAEKVASYSPEALTATKALMQPSFTELDEHVRREAVLFAERMFSPETQAIFQRFVNKK